MQSAESWNSIPNHLTPHDAHLYAYEGDSMMSILCTMTS